MYDVCTCTIPPYTCTVHGDGTLDRGGSASPRNVILDTVQLILEMYIGTPCNVYILCTVTVHCMNSEVIREIVDVVLCAYIKCTVV